MHILTRMWYFLVYGMASDALCCQDTRRSELSHWPNKHKIPNTCSLRASWAKKGWSTSWPPRPASSLWWTNALRVHSLYVLCGWVMVCFTLLKPSVRPSVLFSWSLHLFTPGKSQDVDLWCWDATCSEYCGWSCGKGDSCGAVWLVWSTTAKAIEDLGRDNLW